MITVDEARDRILGAVSSLDALQTPLLESLGQTLAQDVRSEIDVPPYDNSAMDGFATMSDSIRGTTAGLPKVLRVIGEVPAGTQFTGKVTPGTAVRIMTGAPLPAGADTVVPFEETNENDAESRPPVGTIAVRRELPSGCNIRRAAEDIKAGQMVLPRGRTLRPAEIGVLASLGKASIGVVRRPVVSILATGDEITELGQPLKPGMIFNSNTYAIAAAVLRAGGVPRLLGIARDRVEPLREALHAGLEADLLITTGGVSLGDYDLVKNVLAQEGQVSFWTVRMKPGKPLAFGAFRKPGGSIPHLGLPGNPVSSMVSFELFAPPAILKMMGRTQLERPTVMASVDSQLKNTDGRRVFVRVIVTRRQGRYYATPTGEQGSGILTSMALANGLAVVPEEVPLVRSGDEVRVLMLDWDESQAALWGES